VFPPIFFLSQSLPLFTGFSIIRLVALLILSAIPSKTLLQFSFLTSSFTLDTFPLTLETRSLTLDTLPLNLDTFPLILDTRPLVLDLALDSLPLDLDLALDSLPLALELALAFTLDTFPFTRSLIDIFPLSLDNRFFTRPLTLDILLNLPNLFFPLQKLLNPFFKHCSPFLMANSLAFDNSNAFNPAGFAIAAILIPVFTTFAIFLNFLAKSSRPDTMYLFVILPISTLDATWVANKKNNAKFQYIYNM
jgi:hypothetical protein